MPFFRKKIPAYYLVAVVAGGLFLLYSATLIRTPVQTAIPVSDAGHVDVMRRKEGKLVEPLVMIDASSGGQAMKELKGRVETYIRERQAAGDVVSASVAFRELGTSEGFEVNGSMQYLPGSIMKLPILITYLKAAETKPGLLDQSFFFRKHYGAIPEQTIEAPPLAENRSYTVRQLLEKMIIDSDNDATALLNEHIDRAGFLVLFRVLSLRPPDMNSWEYDMTAGECGRFLRVLFNVTYLDEQDSEYALELLTKTSYRDGFSRSQEPVVLLAHKFGERNSGHDQQLHETGIFYLDGRPYLLTVMTSGSDRSRLPGVLAGVSRIVMDARHRGA